MTLKELYCAIGGNYDQAIGLMRLEKLMDKHIRKLPSSNIFAALAQAGQSMDPTQLFEAAHAAKGVYANLGLTQLSELAAEVCDEFRPGNARKLSDDEVRRKLAEIDRLSRSAVDAIHAYEQDAQ